MKDNNIRRDPWENSFYETGRTKPPKNHSGLIAVLLAIIVFLGGIVSGLGFLNIHLFKNISAAAEEDSSFRFSSEDGIGDTEESVWVEGIGLSGQEITVFYQSYYRLPHGFYITDVAPDSSAKAQGITSGDILLRVSGTEVATPAELEGLLQACAPGDIIPVVIYRNGQQHTLDLVIAPVQNGQ